ncbi:MAG: ATP synthase F1 subunit gamma [Oscillospiraceae bacterium]|nr:ATP synthase F1 subunit gamma [Oscillospiraceae bacterium]MDD4367910.1 ATP synthase F1 subunit gamma [Oscillospiraceae bacterium]
MKQISDLKKEIRSVNQIRQMTRAMQMISAVKVRRAKNRLHDAFPFFATCAESMAVLQQQSQELTTPLMKLRDKDPGEAWNLAFYVFSGDQGMAGAYNIRVLNEAENFILEKILERTNQGYEVKSKTRLIGTIGLDRLKSQNIDVEEDFVFPIDPPKYTRVAELSNRIRHAYLNGSLDEIYLIFTSLKNSMDMEVMKIRALPADYQTLTEIYQGHENFSREDIVATKNIEYFPDVRVVLSYLFDTYLNGLLYGAMTEAFASEQTARMTAMDSATENADDLLQDLTVEANMARQARITNELTEIVSGAEALK